MNISVFDIHCADGDVWVNVLEVGERASFLNVSWCCGRFQFDILWLRPLWNWWRDWKDERSYESDK